ncbi:hypothetical protein CANARDRAFT_29366 [[Candida] arabinofermentans NRRL YB-2248]|uniref:Ketoreductase domain-containing protein n=1 Tax=[Candida] arabinofermentans NRRL YB-2248 TaxID=983967 RepID=A0A1E4SXN6_9ASCO|nr:hypothetical protein CANARDRAFT_29366 [[Candida] arabinofermentans NRRL YB-2248]
MSKVVVVTGASRGIGLAIVKHILTTSPGSKVIAVARSHEKLQQIQTQFGSDRVLTIVGDLSQKSTAGKIISQSIAKFGKLDSLVLNAGVLEPVKHIDSIDVDEVRKLFEVNFFSIIELVSAAIPHLRETKGNCIFVSSGASTKAYDGWSAYGASKAALNHFCLSLSAEEELISSISVAPGVVNTEMQADIREKFGVNMKPDVLERFNSLHTNNELLDPEVPGTIYANLALNGIPTSLNGKYLRYDDASLKAFAKN